MESMAPRCSGHKWMPAAGPGLQPGPRACACGVAPTSSLALRGPQGEWGLWQPEDPLSHSRALGKKRMTGGLDRDSEPRCPAQTRLSPGGRHGCVSVARHHGASARAARASDPLRPPATCSPDPGRPPLRPLPRAFRTQRGTREAVGGLGTGRDGAGAGVLGLWACAAVRAPACWGCGHAQPHGLSRCRRGSEPCPV